MPSSATAEPIQRSLYKLLLQMSDENYDQTFAYFRLLVEISQTYYPNGGAVCVDDCICSARRSSAIDPHSDKLIHPTAHLVIRFAKDAESDRIISPQGAMHQTHLCACILSHFFDENSEMQEYKFQREWDRGWGWFCSDANYVAHFANTGHIKESTIRNHILQSLISHPMGLADHQADALIILFKLAGATFEKYADPSVVDRCFELLKGYYVSNSVMNPLVQEVIRLRDHGWEAPEPQILEPQTSEPDPVTGPKVKEQRRKGNPRKKAWAIFSGVF